MPELSPNLVTARGMRVVALGPDEAMIRRGLSEVRVAFPGAAGVLDRLVELADGTRTEAELVASFPADRHDHLTDLLDALRRRALVRDAESEPNVDGPTDAFWVTMEPLAPDGAKRLTAGAVRVLGSGPVADAVIAGLVACGVGRIEVGPGPADVDLWCAAGVGSPDPALTDHARDALAAGALFLPVWLDDLVIRVGPLTYPYDTACLRCYLLRADASDPEREAHRLLRAASGSSGTGYLPTMPEVAGQIAATEAAKLVAGLPVTATGRVLELSLVPFRAAARRVLRVPRCPDCGAPARQGAPVVTRGSQLAG